MVGRLVKIFFIHGMWFRFENLQTEKAALYKEFAKYILYWVKANDKAKCYGNGDTHIDVDPSKWDFYHYVGLDPS